METYEVNVRGMVDATYDNEQKAVEYAETIDDDLHPNVVMVIKSGSYSSRTRVWPTIGETYTN